MTPIAGRECGDCTLCCSVLAIDTEEMQKEPGARCRHCEAGCAIHAARPGACRDFYCAWRTMDIFDDNWRPDRSGVLAQLAADDIGAQTGIDLMLVGNPLKTVRQAWFRDFVATGLAGDIPLFLSLPGPRGYQACRLRLDGAGAVKAMLENALKRLSAHDFRPYRMRHRGNATGSPAEGGQ